MARNKERVRPPDLALATTAEQVMEVARCANDIVYFCRKYVKIQHPVRGSIPFQLYPYQIKMLQAYQDHRYCVVLSSRQTGKALALDTPIATPTGWTTMRDLEVGDQVIGADGIPTNVIATSPIMYDHKCYEVEFDTGETIIADAEHLWEVEDKNKKETVIKTTQQMVDTKYLLGKNESRYKIKTMKPLNLPHREDLIVDPYLLGLWLGDGTSRDGTLTMLQEDFEQISHHIVDRNITYKSFAKLNASIKTIRFERLRTDLTTIGVLHNKHIPLIYKRASHEQRLALLQGLMDTDGYVDSMGRGQCDITIANHTLAKDIHELVVSLGLKPTFVERVVKSRPRWEIKFSAYKNEIPVCRLPRKLHNMKDCPGLTRKQSTKKRSIQKITTVASVPVKCITVDNNDSLFVAGKSMIPTHNSITSAIYLLWVAMFQEGMKILIASNKNAGAMEMVSRIKHAYEELPVWLKPGAKDDGYNKHAIHFENGSIIDSVATTEDSGRGKSVSLLFLDEFAFVKGSIQTEFWSSILPTLSTGGACIMTSTPNGDDNLFAEIWRSAQFGVSLNSDLIKDEEPQGEVQYNDITFYPIQVRWDEPPGRDARFEHQQKSQLGELMWRQEYLCEFLTSDSILIDTIKLQHIELRNCRAASRELDKLTIWDEFKHNATYIIGVDPATGTGKDFTVVQVFEFPSMVQVAEFRSNTMSSPEVYKVLKWIWKQIELKNGTTYFSVENNGVGEGIIALYQNDENPPDFAEFISEQSSDNNTSKRPGFVTSGRRKMKACIDLKMMMENETLVVRSATLIKELKHFARKRDAYCAQLGSTDDCISATLICIRILSEIASFEQEAFDKLYSNLGEWGDNQNLPYDPDGAEDGSYEEPLPFI